MQEVLCILWSGADCGDVHTQPNDEERTTVEQHVTELAKISDLTLLDLHLICTCASEG